MAEDAPEAKRRFTLQLSPERLEQIDALKKEWGLRNRGAVLERLLETLFPGDGESLEPAGNRTEHDPRDENGGEDELDDQAALVLVHRGALEEVGAALEVAEEPRGGSRPDRKAGIDLPGFVRRRSDQLKRSLDPRPPASPALGAPLPTLSGDVVREALQAAREHWLALYGKPASETVVEAAMVWLAQDVWPQSDASEGRPFTWSAAGGVMRELVPEWGEDSPSFANVMVTAGVLEDPFSGSTLVLRIPTLIRRFVHRFRRRPSATSFQTLEHTMTLQGALRLLRLPTDPGHRVTLAQIREAYRELALEHHPDSGGSVEAMRKLNEAYQLLKELYRSRSTAGE